MAEGLNIEGYRILRTLGRGGMATVYLAEQESVQREVALKVMSTTLLGDEQFGQRFLREARIAARMRHPNVVHVYDVGVSGEYHYISMEYIAGGAVMGKAAEPRPVGFALEVTRQIAGALHYAGARGVVHRDIKPDNILLREDGTAVLTDFGIAHAADSSRMTRTGAVIGTPHYMSPEQARGQVLDGRADIYSLGIVLYELLVGRVPYQAEDSMAVGIMHITAPVPELPPALTALQPLLDRMLAKDPAQRYQTGGEVVAAIRTLQQGGELSHETRVLSLAQSMPGAGWGAAEPQLGQMDSVLRAPDRARLTTEGRRRRSWPWVLLAVLVLGIAGGLFFFQDQLRASLPQTRMNALLRDADAALRDGHLSGGEGSARDLYLAASALDPDNQAARKGLQEVASQLLSQARAALEQGNPEPASMLLGEADALRLPSAEVDALASALQAASQSRDHDAELTRVLDAARGAADGGDLDGTEYSAVAQYRRALSMDPGNAVAMAGLRAVLGRLLGQAEQALAQEDFDAADALIERVAAIDPGYLGLPDARAALAKARQSKSDDISARLDAADALLARRQLLPPRQPNALQAYRDVLARDAGQERAREGVRKVAVALLDQATRQIDDYHFDEARELIDQARELAPQLAGLAQVERNLREVQERRSQFESRQASARIDIPSALQRARDAAQAGQFLVPPGESAYDLYRAVLAQVPDNAEARAGLADLPNHALRRFEEALAANRLGTARDALDTIGVIAASDPRLRPARQRLARSYLAFASERLGAGEIQRATEAFNQARELDPDNTELPAMQARLEQARGG